MSVFYPVIPAGGSGKRLWPVSRIGNPKFLHALSGGTESLISETVSRVAKLASGHDRIIVVTSEQYEKRMLSENLALSPSNILLEPSPRDSAPAIALAAAVLYLRDPEAVMGSFAADHVIRNEAAFIAAVEAAIKGAENGLLMTVGMKPHRAETGYGYIQFEGPPDESGVFRVLKFHEKPPVDVAEEYYRSGGYLWNASMFVWKVRVFLDELRLQDQLMYEGLLQIARAWDSENRSEVLERVWPTLHKIAIEYLVMEPASLRGRVGTVEGDFGWTDVGDFHAIGELGVADAHGNVIIQDSPEAGGQVKVRDSNGLVVVHKSNRLLAIIGMHDAVLVDTPDVVLVCRRDQAQAVKVITDELVAENRIDLL